MDKLICLKLKSILQATLDCRLKTTRDMRVFTEVNRYERQLKIPKFVLITPNICYHHIFSIFIISKCLQDSSQVSVIYTLEEKNIKKLQKNLLVISHSSYKITL